MLSKGDGGFIIAKWANDPEPMELEAPNSCLSADGTLASIVVPKGKIVGKKTSAKAKPKAKAMEAKAHVKKALENRTTAKPKGKTAAENKVTPPGADEEDKEDLGESETI